MNEITQITERATLAKPANQHLISMGSEVLTPLTEAITNANAAFERLSKGPNPHLAKRARQLRLALDAFEPSVTLVGQVKAGKTALTNVMAGSIDLLPSDVNPWTSVVTTLHLNSKNPPRKAKAVFSFFDHDEWSNLVARGGRMGELADRAGASEEMEKIQAQIDTMRAQTKARLGDSFEALLGKVHKYGYYDKELIERYVCMGDEDAPGDQMVNKQGRFADITKSAELYVDLPQLKSALILRDTPGVNDTFMVREQITLKSLRGSEICLVVLSANQALNTTDMALLRVIANFEKRQVILFVNRIDELAKPSEQIPEIRASIIETLKANNAAHDCQIIFGSAKWAEAALSGNLDGLSEESQMALLDWAEAQDHIATSDSNAHTWIISGLPELMRAINSCILQGSGGRIIEKMRGQLKNLTAEIKASKNLSSTQLGGTNTKQIQPLEMAATLDKLIADQEEKLGKVTAGLLADLQPRLQKVQASFVGRATNALIAHLDRYGEQDSWQYESTGLRLLLRSAYARFGVTAKQRVGTAYNEAAAEIERIYTDVLGISVDGFKIVPPIAPRIPPPVVLGKTIALDLNGNWWKRWWQKRKGFAAFAKDYSNLIDAEVSSIIQELEETQVKEIFDTICGTLRGFLRDQREVLLRLSEETINGTGAEANAPKHQESELVLGEALTALGQATA